MVLIVSQQHSGPTTPHYVLTCVADDDLIEWLKEDSDKFVWQKEFKTARGLARAIQRSYRAEK